MRSHFISGAAIACAVTGATALMPGIGAAQTAYDSAVGSTYAGGWSAGQNGGYGFGAWSFDGTVDPESNSDPGAQQTISSAPPLGTAWTLFNLKPSTGNNYTGLSDTGRAIAEAGGLQPGQTFETVIENPSTYHFYGGFDILFLNGTDNDTAGYTTSALRVQVFNYFTSIWKINDNSGTTLTPLSDATTAVAGMKLDLTLISTTAYSLTLTPLGGGSAYTQTGTLASSLPINYVNFRLYNAPSTGPTDVADNFGIQYMQIVPEPATLALLGVGFAGLLFLRRRK